MACAIRSWRDARQLQVELEAGHALGRAAELEVHVAVVILAADDVVEQRVALESSCPSSSNSVTRPTLMPRHRAA